MTIEIIIIAIVGVLAGGVVNALADDLPLRRNPRLPRWVPEAKKMAVHYPPEERTADPEEDDPKRPITAWLGITAFLLGKRTSPDGSVKLNWRYPLTEILCALLMVITLVAINGINNSPDYTSEIDIIQTIFWLAYMPFFTLIVVIDIEHKLILFVVIIPMAFLALVDAATPTYQPELADALIGGAAGFGVFFIMYNGGFLFTYVLGAIRGNRIDEIAFGYGDVMLATVSGLVLGWQALIFAMFITVFLGAFGAIIYMLSRRIIGEKYSAFTALPYGPYIVIGTVAMLLYRIPVTDLLLGR